MAATDEDVRRLIAEHGGGDAGWAKVEEAYLAGRFSGDRARAIGVFREERMHSIAAESVAKGQGLAERGVLAAESQADTAKQALDRSNIAIILSIFAGLVAIVDLLTRH
jgi:hypothetical protein